MRHSRRMGIMACCGGWWLYSGRHSVSTVTVDGAPRTLVTLQDMGTLTVGGGLRADIWLCGCGARGMDSVPGSHAGDGGAGAYCAQALDVKLETGGVVVATSPQGATMIGSLMAASANGPSGGTGGGGGAGINGLRPGGLGDGQGKVPFGLDALFAPHCAGGGGGGFLRAEGYAAGGAGGTDGESGLQGEESGFGAPGGAGGHMGGGTGGAGHEGAATEMARGSAADTLCYGAGGGGGGSGTNAQAVAGGNIGAPGVIYLLLKEQEG